MAAPADSPTEPVDYAALNLVYGVALAGLAARAHRAASAHEPIRGPELLPLGAATFALSKVIAREKIGSWMREPFVDEATEDRPPRGRRLRHAVGELVTCTRCVGAWSALGIVGLRVTAPRAGRTVTAVLVASALNDFMQAGFKLLTETTNTVEREAEEQSSAAWPSGGPTMAEGGVIRADQGYGGQVGS